jgi:hypothetical protein
MDGAAGAMPMLPSHGHAGSPLLGASPPTAAPGSRIGSEAPRGLPPVRMVAVVARAWGPNGGAWLRVQFGGADSESPSTELVAVQLHFVFDLVRSPPPPPVCLTVCVHACSGHFTP